MEMQVPPRGGRHAPPPAGRSARSPEALDQALAIDSWWGVNRRAAPDLFLDELNAAIERIALAPGIGREYDLATLPGLRRLLLPRSRYHVYYGVVAETTTVRVHAIWHALPRQGPPLP
jgi:plasmid stabilization system protein ParE